MSRDLESWEQLKPGPAYPEGGERRLEQIWRIAARGDELYCGVAEAGLFRSRDGGVSWEPFAGLNDHPSRSGWEPGAGGLCAHSILFDARRPERLWCGISAVGVFRSDDGGRTWVSKNDGIPKVVPNERYADTGWCVHALAQDPDDPDLIYRQDHAGMFRTRDGGESWEENRSGLPANFGFPLVMDPHTRALFAFPQESDEARFAPEGHFCVYCSRDRGDSWQPLGRGLPDDTYVGVLRGAMAVDGREPCGVYVGSTGGGLYVSRDCGERWRALPFQLPRIGCVEAFDV